MTVESRDSVLERLPEHLQSKAISLASFGAKEVAWPAQDALAVAAYCE